MTIGRKGRVGVGCREEEEEEEEAMAVNTQFQQLGPIDLLCRNKDTRSMDGYLLTYVDIYVYLQEHGDKQGTETDTKRERERECVCVCVCVCVKERERECVCVLCAMCVFVCV